MNQEPDLGSPLTLAVERSELQGLCRHAEREYPKECCGILIGRRHPGGSSVTRAVPAHNQRRVRAHERYEIAAVDVVRAMHEAADSNADIVGYYHSHPDRTALPSSTDEGTAWPGVSYVIVAVMKGQAGEVRSWRRCAGQLVEERLLATNTPERCVGSTRDD